MVDFILYNSKYKMYGVAFIIFCLILALLDKVMVVVMAVLEAICFLHYLDVPSSSGSG